MALHKKSPDEMKELRVKVKDYAKTQFNIHDTIDDWDRTMTECMEKFKTGYKAWECEEL